MPRRVGVSRGTRSRCAGRRPPEAGCPQRYAVHTSRRCRSGCARQGHHRRMARQEQAPSERHSDDPTACPVSYRTAREAGVSRRSLDGPLWRRTSRGFYVWAGGDADDVAVCVAQAAALLPTGAALSGWASLNLQGAVDLDGGADLNVGRVAGLRRPRGGTPRPSAPAVRAGRAPVLVSVGPSARIRPRTGLDLSRRELPDDEVVMVGDVPCVVARRAVVEMMGRQPPEEALVTIDAFLRAGLGALEEVHGYLDEHPRIRAAARIRRVLSMADGRARSCPESRLRWIWVVEARLPRPLVNVPIRDAAGR